jgi:hypothetical protein
MTLSCSAEAGCDPVACEAGGTLDRAVSRYGPILSPLGAPPPEPTEILLDKIEVCVINANEALGPAMNESHALAVPGGDTGPTGDGVAIRIDAASQHGTLRALESLAHTI